MRLMKIFYIISSIIVLIVAYIYFQYDLSSFHKTILRTITYSLATILGCFLIIKPNFFSENDSALENRVLGVILLVIGLSKILLGWV